MQPHVRRLCLLLAFLSAHLVWAADVLPVVPAGDGTYKITAKATHKFTRNTRKLEEAAMAAATEFCAKEGKQLKVVSVDGHKSQYLVGGFAQVTLTFKALDAGDAGLAPAAAAPAPDVAPPTPMNVDQLQSELTKLDEMRTKGLLTDAEFETLKQKLLSRF